MSNFGGGRIPVWGQRLEIDRYLGQCFPVGLMDLFIPLSTRADPPSLKRWADTNDGMIPSFLWRLTTH
jgi:hypothetical protein